jgi:hypothetical protein
MWARVFGRVPVCRGALWAMLRFPVIVTEKPCSMATRTRWRCMERRSRAARGATSGGKRMLLSVLTRFYSVFTPALPPAPKIYLPRPCPPRSPTGKPVTVPLRRCARAFPHFACTLQFQAPPALRRTARCAFYFWLEYGFCSLPLTPSFKTPPRSRGPQLRGAGSGKCACALH